MVEMIYYMIKLKIRAKSIGRVGSRLRVSLHVLKMFALNVRTWMGDHEHEQRSVRPNCFHVDGAYKKCPSKKVKFQRAPPIIEVSFARV